METLNKSNLDIAIIAKGERVPGILVTKDRTVVNDSRRLVEVTRPKFNAEDFPKVPGFEQKQENDFILPITEALQVSRQIPKAKKDLSILKNAIIEQNNRVRIATTDLSSASIVDVNPIEGKYPEYQEVIPQGKLKHRMESILI